MSTIKSFLEGSAANADICMIRNNSGEVLFYGTIENLKVTKYWNEDFHSWNWETFKNKGKDETCFVCKYDDTSNVCKKMVEKYCNSSTNWKDEVLAEAEKISPEVLKHMQWSIL